MSKDGFKGAQAMLVCILVGMLIGIAFERHHKPTAVEAAASREDSRQAMLTYLRAMEQIVRETP